MNRREFVGSAAAGAALLARVDVLAAGPKRLMVKGGRVIDPSVRLDAQRRETLPLSAAASPLSSRTSPPKSRRDARRARQARRAGADRHPHACRRATKPAHRCAWQDGVTGWVDAGSAGADASMQAAAVARARRSRARPRQHRRAPASARTANSTRSASPTWRRPGRDRAPSRLSSSASRHACRTTSQASTIYEALRRTRRRRRRSGLPVMIHIGQNASPLAQSWRCSSAATSSRTCLRRR